VVGKKPSLDIVDLLTLPFFVGTMILEHRSLKRRTLRDLEEPDAVIADDDGNTTPDPLVPLGYEKKDTYGSLGLLVGNIAIGFALQGAIGRVNRRLFDRRLSNFGNRRFALLKAMILWDFLYYWNHRWMHEVRLFWGNHVAHHSGRRYNLSTALRQPWFFALMTWVYWPMHLLGFRGRTVDRAAQLNLLYQYWIHTEAIDRLPAPIERVFNTPSHHRVHHGANRQYLDRNYGGILIVWDKLFGTFEPEIRRVRYGLTKNITTHNPVRAATHEMMSIAGDVRRARSTAERLRYVFGRPGWQPDTVTRPPSPSVERVPA